MRDDGNGSAAIMQHHPAGDVPTEDARLDDAIRKADELLVSSLKSEEQDRSRRRRTFTFTLIGGLIMTAATCIIIAVLAQTSAAPAANNAGAARQAAATNASADDLAAEGWQLWQARKLTDAEAKFDQALKLDPKHVNAWNGLGWARFNLGKREPAEKAFAECVKLQPDHPAALNGLGWINFGRRNYAQAEKHFLAAAPTASASWAGLAQLYLLEGKYDQALPWAILVSREPNADPTMTKQLLEAARSRKLDPALRKQIEPEAEKK